MQNVRKVVEFPFFSYCSLIFRHVIKRNSNNNNNNSMKYNTFFFVDRYLGKRFFVQQTASKINETRYSTACAFIYNQVHSHDRNFTLSHFCCFSECCSLLSSLNARCKEANRSFFQRFCSSFVVLTMCNKMNICILKLYWPQHISIVQFSSMKIGHGASISLPKRTFSTSHSAHSPN